jgi:hypothetical protein
MKTKWLITFDARHSQVALPRFSVAADCGPDVARCRKCQVFIFKGIDVRVKLDDGDERIAKLHELLKRYGVEVEEFDYDRILRRRPAIRAAAVDDGRMST